MATINELTKRAKEKGTFPIVAAFKDEDGDPVTPNSGLTWTLTDQYGAVINDREDVAITPATSVTVVLQGDDLALPDPNRNIRVLTIEGDYDSSLGSELPLKDQVQFEIENLVAVT